MHSCVKIFMYGVSRGVFMKYLSRFLLVFLIAGCSALPKSFTTKNIMKVKQGMSSEEILKMFGEPKNIGQSVCGGATGKTWTCTTWEYGDTSCGNAKFTFSGQPGTYKLNSFDVDRDVCY